VRGLVSNDELVDLYRRAAVLVFPSLYEGFGQPPLEAMACGCPVACSTAGSLPEIAGDAAPHEWAERGLSQAARFSWDDTARAHDAVYRELSTRA
jgi:glycosyltransferase involved in cell wall biosynthesis